MLPRIGRTSALKLVPQERRSQDPGPAPVPLEPAIPGAPWRGARRLAAAAWGAGGAGLVLVVVLLARTGLPEVLRVLRSAGWSLLWLAPLHVAPLAAVGAAWRVLVRGRRAPSLGYVAWASAVREAIGTVVPMGQVGADVAGVPLLVRRGVPGAAAGASVVVDVTATMAAQLLFACVGLVLLLRHSATGAVGRLVALGLLAGAAATAAFVLVQRRWGLFGLAERVLAAVAGGRARWLFGDPARLDREVRALYAERGRLAAALALQVVATLAGAGETWVALRLLGHPVSVGAALVVESITTAVRSATFFVPSGLGTQEGSFLLVGGAVGVRPDVALALSLAVRARQLVVGLPALVWWWWAERPAGR